MMQQPGSNLAGISTREGFGISVNNTHSSFSEAKIAGSVMQTTLQTQNTTGM